MLRFVYKSGTSRCILWRARPGAGYARRACSVRGRCNRCRRWLCAHGRKPAASLLHLGPGLANGLANLHNAKKARSPVVNIIGDHATYHQLLEAPLTSDVKAFAAPVSQWIKSSPNGAEVGHDAAAAVRAANSNGGQIASLILPADTAWTPAHDYGVYRKPPSPEIPPAAAIEKISALLSNGKKTSILMTGQALRARGLEAASRIAAKSGAQVFADTFNARTERGAGRYGIKRLPYFAEQIVETLAGTEQLIIVGSQSPVSFSLSRYSQLSRSRRLCDICIGDPCGRRHWRAGGCCGRDQSATKPSRAKWNSSVPTLRMAAISPLRFGLPWRITCRTIPSSLMRPQQAASPLKCFSPMPSNMIICN